MRGAILQPNYIPWRGYFNFFKLCDVFVVYDDVQYTKNDWRNRNTIKTPDGIQWMTVPVKPEKHDALIRDVKVTDNNWQKRHLKMIEHNYKNAPYYDEVMHILRRCFLKKYEYLIKVDMDLIEEVLDYLGINCEIFYSSDIGFSDLHKTDRLVEICKAIGIKEYLSGEAAKTYLEPGAFGDVRVMWHKYADRVYPQLWGDFITHVSIIDMLFNCGRKAYELI